MVHELREHLERYNKEDLLTLKNRQLYIPHYGRDRNAYDIVNNYFSESVI